MVYTKEQKEKFDKIPLVRLFDYNFENVNNFKVDYLKAFNTNLEIDLFPWEVIEDEIFSAISNHWYESGDVVEIEVSSFYSVSGNPVMIVVGEIEIRDDNEFYEPFIIGRL